MNQYETVFILTPVLSDEQMKETVFAYPIDKKTTGFYVLIEFNAAPETIKTLEIAYRRDEKVLRFLTVKMEKYAAEYAAKRRSNKQAKEQEA